VNTKCKDYEKIRVQKKESEGKERTRKVRERLQILILNLYLRKKFILVVIFIVYLKLTVQFFIMAKI